MVTTRKIGVCNKLTNNWKGPYMAWWFDVPDSYIPEVGTKCGAYWPSPSLPRWQSTEMGKRIEREYWLMLFTAANFCYFYTCNLYVISNKMVLTHLCDEEWCLIRLHGSYMRYIWVTRAQRRLVTWFMYIWYIHGQSKSFDVRIRW